MCSSRNKGQQSGRVGLTILLIYICLDLSTPLRILLFIFILYKVHPNTPGLPTPPESQLLKDYGVLIFISRASSVLSKFRKM